MSRLVSASEVTGHAVLDTHGVKLGTIEHIMLDKYSGTVAYAMLSFGDFLGMGGKHVALPWQALNYNREHDAFIVNIDRETLEAAPGFDKDNPPDFEDRAWAEEVHVFFSVTPYWDDAGGWGGRPLL